MSGECCQWVLDAVRETVEWQSATRVQLPHSPHYTRQILKSLDNDRAGTIIKVADGVQYLASAPDDYRGFRISESDWVDSPAPHDPFDRLD